MPDQPRMWVHYCNVDYCWHGIGAAEECAWCGRKEEDEPIRIGDAPASASGAHDVGYNFSRAQRKLDAHAS